MTKEQEYEEKNKRIELAQAYLNKEFGKGTIFRYDSDEKYEWPSIPTGSMTLDIALGIGGVPRGRIVEIFGPEACLASDTFIQYEIRKKDGTRQNHKGGSIERLYHRFNGLNMAGSGNYAREATKDSIYFASCMNEEGRIFQNRILDVVSTGVKSCYKLTTDRGLTITATGDHKFYVGDKFQTLENLMIGDSIFIHNNTPFKVDEPYWVGRESRKEVTVKNHPYGSVKVLQGKYTYKRLMKSRVIVEADMNGLSFEEYKERLNDNRLDGLMFLKPEDHVHHLDENSTNDDFSNLVVIKGEDHTRSHALDRHNNLRYRVVEDRVKSIDFVGEESTYDIKMEAPFNNYVAAGFVVHNSGKSTLCMTIVAEAQKSGGICAYVDSEHALDPKYARNLGVKFEDLIVSQPDYGEQALDIVDRLARTGAIDVIVVDSVASLAPKAEIEGTMHDMTMGSLAKMMSQHTRKIKGVVAETQTCLIFVNQIREKIGVMFGNPETTPGGRALKFDSSVRLDIRRKEDVKSNGEKIGHTARVKVVKNRMAPPYKEAEFDILWGRGINNFGCVLDLAVERGLLIKSGAWYKTLDELPLGQGRTNAFEYLANDLDLYEKLKEEILNG